MDDKVFYIILILVICSLFLDKFKKENRGSYFFSFIVYLGCSAFFFAASNHNFRLNQIPFNDQGKRCISRQRDLNSAIRRYQIEKKISLPDNFNQDELIELQKDYLIKGKYIKNLINDISRKECVFEIKDGFLYCREHGSHDLDSPFYTEGFPTYDNGKSKKEFLEKVELVKKKREEQVNNEKNSFKLAILFLLPSLKIFIFFIKSFF